MQTVEEKLAKRRAIAQKWHAKNSQKCAEYSKAHYKNNPLKRKWYGATADAKRKGYASYSFEDLVKWYPEANVRANGHCECRQKPTQKLLIDHCHKTGKLRGLLCWSCNIIEGHAQDTEHLKKVVSYMEKHTNGTD